ncbi:DUF502 domain-containing protein [Fodinicurvata sp. EGI_FJ10296]|uniref:DUF502 domain-containing protein n=1 Tax=Fodinicurvata sp. EGI_FJ10296 TaxID=3231908 RepID=UPI0034517A70
MKDGSGHDQARPFGKNMSLGARMRAYFIAGVLVTAPIVITFYVIWMVVSFVDDVVASVLPPRFDPTNFLPFPTPGLGLILVVAGLILIGATTAGYAGRLLVRLSDRIMVRIPAVSSIYGATKQVFETLLANQSSAFRQVVLVEYPRPGIWALAFVTGDTKAEVQNLTEDDVVNIFLPTTPNPTSGFLLFVPKRDILLLTMTVEEGIKMVMSGGIVTPPDRRRPEEQAVPTIASRPPPSDLVPADMRPRPPGARGCDDDDPDRQDRAYGVGE